MPKDVRNKDPFALSNTALYPPIRLDYEDLAHAYAKNKARKGPRIATKSPAKPVLKPSTKKANHQVPKRKSPTPDNWRNPHAPNSNWRAQPPAQPTPEDYIREKGIRAIPVGQDRHQGRTHFLH